MGIILLFGMEVRRMSSGSSIDVVGVGVVLSLGLGGISDRDFWEMEVAFGGFPCCYLPLGGLVINGVQNQLGHREQRPYPIWYLRESRNNHSSTSFKNIYVCLHVYIWAEAKMYSKLWRERERGCLQWWKDQNGWEHKWSKRRHCQRRPERWKRACTPRFLWWSLASATNAIYNFIS